MSDIVSGETNHEMLRAYKDKKLVNGGLVVCWTYDYEADLIFVGASLCNPNDLFNKKEGRYIAEHRMSDALENGYTSDSKETSFIISQSKIIDYVESIGLLPELYFDLSTTLFMSINFGKIGDSFSFEFIHKIIMKAVVGLWHDRYDKNNEYEIIRLQKGHQ